VGSRAPRHKNNYFLNDLSNFQFGFVTFGERDSQIGIETFSTTDILNLWIH